MAFWNEISNFAATVPATPLLESVPRQDFVFIYYIKVVCSTQNKQSIFNSCLDNIATEVNRSREDFISEYYNNYTAPSFPPAWKTLEVVSFGTLSKLFCNFKDNSVKKKVAKEFLLPQYLYLENWINLRYLRNLRDLFFVPQISQIHTDSWFGFKVTQIPQMTQMIGDVIPKTPQK